jgi:hypothetical protein
MLEYLIDGHIVRMVNLSSRCSCHPWFCLWNQNSKVNIKYRWKSPMIYEQADNRTN